MALKKLLVAFTTTRMIAASGSGKEEERRVRFAAGKVVDLSDEELDLLDRLTKNTGKLHYRDPVSEGGSRVIASEPEVVNVPDFAGQDVAIPSKTVDQLKAYLTFHEVEFPAKAGKSDLVELAQKHASGSLDGEQGGEGGQGDDPDSGL